MRIFSLPDRNNSDDSFFSDFRAKYYKTNTPIVIDNGTYFTRAGWGDEEVSRMQFRPQAAKLKSKDQPPSILVGNDIRESEIAKLNPRTQFEQNVVYHFETQEFIFDHIFQRLGIDTQTISNPVLMTEAICNPIHCRAGLSELLFECYGAPGVCYGIDSIFSLYANSNTPAESSVPAITNLPALPRTCLVISSSHSATHVFPVVNHQWVPNKCKRLQIGGLSSSEYLRKLLHLKYPVHRNVVNAVRSQYLKEEHAYVAVNYNEELEKYNNSKDNLVVIQLPFTPQASVPKADQDRKAQVRKEQGLRLKEINEKKREEKRAVKEERLNCLLEIKEMQNSDNMDDFYTALEEEGLRDEEELNVTITELEESLGKPLSINQPADEDEQFPLVDIPDDELTEEQLAEKQKQKFLKKMRDGRLAIKKKRDETKQLEDDRFNQNPQQYLADLHSRRQALLARREERLKSSAAVTGRRARGRMNIKALAMRDAEETKKTGKRKAEDTFGANDADWDVYLDNQEVMKEEEDIQLAQIETLLATYDPDFAPKEGGASGLNSAENDEESMYQLHLGVERIRVPETVFQPQAILGMEQMGLVEIIQSILETFDKNVQQEMAMNIFFTGGNTAYEGFEERLKNEIQAIRPFQSQFVVKRATDLTNDAWRGMTKWFQTNPEEFKNSVVLKAEYEERGGDYFKPFFASNVPLPQ